MRDEEMFDQLRSYRNGIHGDFFLDVCNRLVELKTLIMNTEPVATSPAAMAGSAALPSKIAKMVAGDVATLEYVLSKTQPSQKDWLETDKEYIDYMTARIQLILDEQ